MEETKTSVIGKLSSWFDEKLSPKMAKVANQRHLLAVRNGIVCTIPFIIVGSMALLILNFPVSGDPNDPNLGGLMPVELNHFLMAIYRYSMGAMGLFAAFGIGSYLGKHYGFNNALCGMMAIFAYFLWFDYATLTINSLGGATIFSAMVSGLLAVEIYRFCIRFNLTIKMPKQVPEAVSDSFKVLVPITLIAVLFGGARWLIGFDINNFLTVAMAPLNSLFNDNLGGVILLVIFVHFFWIFGIHGTSIMGSVVRPFWTIAITANGETWMTGVGEFYKYPEQFLQWGVYVGGSGVTLGLILSGLIFGKSKQAKAITRASALPGVFNINEPAIYGYPIMLNPILMVPFFFVPIIVVPVAALLCAILGTHWVVAAPWTLPAPIGAYFASGASWTAIFIPLVTLAIATVIWAPFFIKWDRDMYKLEIAEA